MMGDNYISLRLISDSHYLQTVASFKMTLLKELLREEINIIPSYFIVGLAVTFLRNQIRCPQKSRPCEPTHSFLDLSAGSAPTID